VLFRSVSQILLKLGMNRLAGVSAHDPRELFTLIITALKNPYLMIGAALLASSFFLWLVILSWFKLSLVFPLTALTYVFVAVLSYFVLGERLLLWQNYAGIVILAAGVFFLLYR
jgi:drug/metabolite transporter (DMT)-like permease